MWGALRWPSLRLWPNPLQEAPVNVDVALAERGELRERGAREVEAVGGAAGAKVGHGDGDRLAGV